jgi:uncharacterized protein
MGIKKTNNWPFNAIAAAVLLGLCFMTGPIAGAFAQSRGASYLPPFPKSDTYKLLVVGDDFSYGLRQGLEKALSDSSRVTVENRPYHIQGLFRTDISAVAAKLENELKSRDIGIVVVMVGARDAVRIRNASGKRFQVGTPVWRKEYAARIEQLKSVFQKAGVAIYWVGLPVTSRSRLNGHFQLMNEILRESAYREGIKFVDVFSRFADERDRFNAYGPDLSGETRLMRSRDGVYFTDSGNLKLAHFAEKLIRRDLTQASRDRQIPLAGSEVEQARILAGKRVASVRAGAAAEDASGSGDEAAAREAVVASSQRGGGEDENHGKIKLRVRNATGNEQIVSLDVLRPAIPASVVSLIRRRADRNKPAQIGDTLVDNIPGGLTVMSSIAPSASGPAGRRRVISPTQTPFFRVLVKGEPLPAKPGRIDDFSWPKSAAATQR